MKVLRHRKGLYGQEMHSYHTILRGQEQMEQIHIMFTLMEFALKM